jgi:hypothetical protein
VTALTIYHLTRELAQMGHIIDFLGFTQDTLMMLHYLKANMNIFYRDIAFLPETSRSPSCAMLERLLLPAKPLPQAKKA